MGAIIAVVAVLVIHIDRSDATRNNPQDSLHKNKCLIFHK
jgi:hypothetical protein